MGTLKNDNAERRRDGNAALERRKKMIADENKEIGNDDTYLGDTEED